MQSELIGEFSSQVDKKRLVEMLMNNSNNLKGLSIKLSVKADALEELVKLIVEGDLDYIDSEKSQKVVEDSIDSQSELITNVNSDSVCEQQEA